MFEEYKEDLRNFYLEKKAANQLPDALDRPERQKLRRECLRVLTTRNSKHDQEVVRAFFDPINQYEELSKSIEKFDLDRFRPIVNFLTKGTAVRSDESVKLLAWLLGFDSYHDWRLKRTSEEIAPKETLFQENLLPVTELVEPTSLDEGVKVRQQFTRERASSTTILIGSLSGMVILATVFLVYQHLFNHGTQMPTSNQKCMYWTGKQFRPIECGAKNVRGSIVPLNLGTLKNQRRLFMTDTLTKRSLGKVWYLKRNGQHEFFTDSGRHPIDTQKMLKPLSRYILSNHVSYHRFLLKGLIWSLVFISSVGYLIMTFKSSASRK